MDDVWLFVCGILRRWLRLYAVCVAGSMDVGAVLVVVVCGVLCLWLRLYAVCVAESMGMGPALVLVCRFCLEVLFVWIRHHQVALKFAPTHVST